MSCHVTGKSELKFEKSVSLIYQNSPMLITVQTQISLSAMVQV